MPLNDYKKKLLFDKKGVFLAEILLTLIVVSSALLTMFSGFDSAFSLSNQASFETQAAFKAEREMEFFKSEMLANRIPQSHGSLNSFFRLKPGWKINTVWTKKDIYSCVRIITTVKQGERQLKIESFLFHPDGEKIN